MPGPRRTIVAVVEGYPEGLSGYVICADQEVLVNQGIHIYGDVGSNGDISLLGPSTNAARIRNDPPPPYENPENRYYSGSARAVCPTFAPGATDLTISSPTTAYTMNSTTGYTWRDVTIRAAGTSSGCTGSTPFRDLTMQTGAAGTTTVVNVRRLRLERRARLIIAGEGTADLRVSVRSSAMDPAAVQIDRASIVSGTWNVSNGKLDPDRMAGQVGQFYGAILARRANIDRDLVFTYDPSAVPGSPSYANFTRLRSWKDQ